MTPGGHCWGNYPGILPPLVGNCNSFEDRLPVYFTYGYTFLQIVAAAWFKDRAPEQTGDMTYYTEEPDLYHL